MICNVEINDKSLKEALYTLFGQRALDDLIKETVNQEIKHGNMGNRNNNFRILRS
jgi:hypothetical protein